MRQFHSSQPGKLYKGPFSLKYLLIAAEWSENCHHPYSTQLFRDDKTSTHHTDLFIAIVLLGKRLSSEFTSRLRQREQTLQRQIQKSPFKMCTPSRLKSSIKRFMTPTYLKTKLISYRRINGNKELKRKWKNFSWISRSRRIASTGATTCWDKMVVLVAGVRESQLDGHRRGLREGCISHVSVLWL